MATPGSVEWWLDRLDRRLNEKARVDRLRKLDNYYRGTQPLLFASDQFMEVFADLLKPLAINFVSLVVDAAVERMTIQGFQSATDDSDEAANAIWRANDMDAWAITAHREALVKSECALIVWPDSQGRPTISVEDARTIIVDANPGQLTDRRGALKRWADGETAYATLYLPEAVYKFEQPLNSDARQALEQGTSVGVIETSSGGWKRREVADEAWPLPNPLDVLPVIPLVNRPDLFGRGQSEMEPVLPIQDVVNYLACCMVITSEFAAYPQRYMTGVETKDPETGEENFAFRGYIDRILAVAAPDAAMGSFEAADLENYTKAIDDQVNHMASISHTPRHYLLGSGVIPNAESTTSAESGLVSKVRSHQAEKGPTWAEVMRVARMMNGETDPRPVTPIWKDPERRSWSEFTDALAKEAALGIPHKMLWKKMGYSPDEIIEIERLRAEEAQRLAQAFDPASPFFDPAELEKRAVPFGELVRAGTRFEDAAAQAGLPDLEATGDLPVTTRPADGAPVVTRPAA